MPHRVTTEPRGGRTVYTLHDDDSGASASILPSYGFNLFDLRLPVAGEVRRVVQSAPDFVENPVKPARNGIPVLFPYPNRIARGTFDFRGKTYSLPINSGTNSIHGFTAAAPWDVVEQSTEGGEASLTGRYQISKNTPAMAENWPTDAILEIRHALSGRTLTMTVRVTNPTADDLPYGFGIHPYFRLPIDPEGDAENTRVIVPASEYWVLDKSIPTGETRPVGDRLDFRKGQPRKGLTLDDVLTGLEFEGDRCVCRLEDQNLKAEFRLTFDRMIREIVMFTPPAWPDAIAVEPYTQTTDAVHLAEKGIDGGLRVLGHGETETITIVMETVG